MNGFNQFGNQAYQPQAVGFNQQQQQNPSYKFQDGDNWVQLLSLQERQNTKQYPDNFGGMRNVTKTIRDVLANGQQFAIFLTQGANQQLQGCIQAVLASGKNPLEVSYNIRKNRFSPAPMDVRYQVVTGEWVGLNQAIQQNAYGQPRTQAIQSPAPPLPYQQPMAYPQNAPQMPFKPMEIGQISKIPQQVVQNPFQQGISPNVPIMPMGIQENAIVLSEQEKTLLEMAEQSPERLEKADFINKWVLAMRTQFNEPNYPILRADIVYSQFYQK